MRLASTGGDRPQEAGEGQKKSELSEAIALDSFTVYQGPKFYPLQAEASEGSNHGQEVSCSRDESSGGAASALSIWPAADVSMVPRVLTN